MKRLIVIALATWLSFGSFAVAAEEHGAPAGAAAPDHAAADAHAEVDPGKQLLTPDVKAAIFNLLMFLGLLAVLAKFVWPKILDGLRAREQRIRDDLQAADQANADAKSTLVEYQKKLTDAHAESRKLIEQARVDADKLRDELTKQTDQEMQRLRQRATEEIGLAKQQAVADLHAHAAELAVAVAAKILQRQVTPGDTEQLVRQSLAELEKVKQN